MQVRWTTLASEDLQRITRHIQRDNPTAAREGAQKSGFGDGRVETATEILGAFLLRVARKGDDDGPTGVILDRIGAAARTRGHPAR